MSKRKSLVPPRFSIGASQFLHDRNLPDHLHRTYARITSLAWQSEPVSYLETPPLTLYELEALWGISVRNLRRHITELKRCGCLDWETITDAHGLKRLVFYPVWPDTPPPGSPLSDRQKPTPAAPQETLKALAEYGVDVRESFACHVAALPHVTPELVRAWGGNLRQRPGIQNLPGLLLHLLQRSTEPPAEAEPASGDRRPPSSSAPLQAALPETSVPLAGQGPARPDDCAQTRSCAAPPSRALPSPSPPSPASPPPRASQTPLAAHDVTFNEALPADLRQALEGLGWSGDDAWAEAAGVAARVPDFVWAWVWYVEAHPDLGPGFLRAQLRGTTWPSTKKSSQEREQARTRMRWREQWQSQDDGDHPPLHAPSPREEAMERYGIAPETMQVWEKAQAELALQMARATFDTHLRNTLLLSADDGRAIIGVRHVHSASWLQNRLDKVIQRTLTRHLAWPVEELTVVVLNDAEEETDS